ncbi:MAG: MBL fold metallo-hydrolase [Aestuariibacter sp.]
MKIETFHDPLTSTFTYLVIDEQSQKSAVIDSVLDYDQFSGKTATHSADKVVDYIKQNGLHNEWLLETHVHADHITAAHYLQQQVGGKIAIGKEILTVLAMWIPVFETEQDTPLDGSQFDVLWEDGESFQLGELEIKVWFTPGHTPACVSYLVEDHIFVGDTMFAPHLGTARCDFPGGSARQLFQTVQRFYTLPENTLVHLGHDYPNEGETAVSCVTVAQAKQENIHIKPDTELTQYVQKRTSRDATLAVPKLLLPAIQANLRNGQFGAASATGKQFIKIPINQI